MSDVLVETLDRDSPGTSEHLDIVTTLQPMETQAILVQIYTNYIIAVRFLPIKLTSSETLMSSKASDVSRQDSNHSDNIIGSFGT